MRAVRRRPALLASALVAGIGAALAACGDGDDPVPGAAALPDVTPDAGRTDAAGSGDGGLPPLGPLAIDAPPQLDVVAGTNAAVSARVAGGAGPYRIAWRAVAGPPATVHDADTLNPSLAVPSVTAATDLTLEVDAADTSGAATKATMILHLLPPPTTTGDAGAGPLVASAGADQTVSAGAAAFVNALASGGAAPYRYAWTQKDGPIAGIDPPDGSNPKLHLGAVAVDATVTWTVTVTDAHGATATDDVALLVKAPPADQLGDAGAGYRPLTDDERTVVSCIGDACSAPSPARVVCDARAPFALTTLDFDGHGGIGIQKRCVDASICLGAWWLATAPLDQCVSLLPPTRAPFDGIDQSGAAAMCSFCCYGLACNAGAVPALGTIASCDQNVCFPPNR